MSRLVRARPKKIEDLPECFKCCEDQIRAAQDLGEMTLDLSRTRVRACAIICGCGIKHNHEMRQAPDIADGLFVPLEILDLDEGEYTP